MRKTRECMTIDHICPVRERPKHWYNYKQVHQDYDLNLPEFIPQRAVSKLQAKFVRMQRVWLKQKHLAILVYVEGWEGTKESSDFEGWRMYVQRRCNPVLSTVFCLHQMLGWTCLFCFGLSFFSASMLKQSPRTKRLRTASGTPTCRSSLFDRGMWPCGKSN